MTTEKKREREKKVVEEMIRIYCRRKHGTKKKDLCPDCAKLRDYAFHRSDVCPFMKEKTFCSNCRIHCYSPEMKAKIREVMRFSGPRMLLHRPLMAIHHVISSKLEKKRLEKALKDRK
ncbi:MAG TPA: nitrous oxide-stimulated promoter family protein [Candidatus Enterosoma merdigallinarum]|nr:nitrous oxide-stimulated promoter family protein [Candidatus Enterosoma merdigallinarum]